MNKPRLISYNDARHYSFYRYDPPMSLHQLRQPVDEILGTEVDLLCYGLASGATFLHDTQVGVRWGQGVSDHTNGVMWWRAARNLEAAIAAGNDPLRVVVERAHEKGRRVLCSLRMNDPAPPDAASRYFLGRLKQSTEHLIGEVDPDNPHVATCPDFAREAVRQERLDVIEEVCERYGADGLEMDPYVGVFFKRSEVEMHTPLLTEFVRQVRELLDRIGQRRGERLWLSARVHPEEDQNLRIGMDVGTWLQEGLLDLVVPTGGGMLFDPEMPIDWLVNVASLSGAWVYPSVGRVPYDDRHHEPPIEMYRAAAANFRMQGADGLYMADLPWPYRSREYQILREMGDADITARKTKLYQPAPRETTTPGRVLPITLEEGDTATVPLLVGDDLAGARDDGELRALTLRVRIVQYCPEDELAFAVNGQTLRPMDISHFYGGLVAYSAHRGGLPERIDTHYWFAIDVPLGVLRQGINEISLTLDRRFAPLVAERVLQQIELEVAYHEPAVPRGGQM